MQEHTEKKKRKTAWAEIIFLTVILIIPLTQFAVMYVGVNFNSILMSFQRYDSRLGDYVFMGTGNFKQFFSDIINSAELGIAVKNSAINYIASLVIALPLCLLISYYIYKKMLLNGVFKVVVFIPNILSNVIMITIFKYLVESGLGKVLGMNLLTNIDTAFWTILAYNQWIALGVNMILLTGAMSRVPETLIEAAQLEAITYFKEFTKIVLPLIFPTITTILVTGVASFFTNQASIYILYGDSAPQYVNNLAYYIFIKVAGATASYAEYPYASSAGIVFTLVAAPLTILVKTLLEKFGPKVEY